jgi:crossover junction endodeoxyribonuclease RuvC
MSKVLGIDPGLSETGWAVLNAEGRLAASGLIKTEAGLPLPQRLRALHQELSEIIGRHAPDEIAVEEMFFMKAAVAVRATLQARGVILLAAAQAGKTVSPYNPRTVKLALTGNGDAPKAQMQKMLQRALNLPDILRPDDVADAAAIAVCHVRSTRFKKFKVLEAHSR